MCYHEHTLFSYIDIDLRFPPKPFSIQSATKCLPTSFIHPFEANTISYHITSLALHTCIGNGMLCGSADRQVHSQILMLRPIWQFSITRDRVFGVGQGGVVDCACSGRI
jgi:hypothetical protein